MGCGLEFFNWLKSTGNYNRIRLWDTTKSCQLTVKNVSLESTVVSAAAAQSAATTTPIPPPPTYTPVPPPPKPTDTPTPVPPTPTPTDTPTPVPPTPTDTPIPPAPTYTSTPMPFPTNTPVPPPPTATTIPVLSFGCAGKDVAMVRRQIGLEVACFDAEYDAFVWRSTKVVKATVPQGFIATLYLPDNRIIVTETYGEYNILEGTFRRKAGYPSGDAVHNPCLLLSKEQEYASKQNPSYPVEPFGFTCTTQQRRLSFYDDTKVGMTKQWSIPVEPDKTLIVGGYSVNGVSGGVYQAIPGGQSVNVSVTDGFVLTIINNWARDEFCFRLSQAKQFGWAHSVEKPLPSWQPCQ